MKIHKTHFQVDWNIKLKSKKDKKIRWVEIAPGRYKLVRNAKRAKRREVTDG